MLLISSSGSIPALSLNNWIVVHQRLTTDHSLFNQSFSGYQNGFGTINGSFWMGNENIHLLTQTGSQPYKLRVEMLSTGNQWRSAEYSSFSLDDNTHKYTLHVNGYSGDAGDSLQYTGYGGTVFHNGQKFSTFDQDTINSCAERFGNAGWWYKDCYMCCLTCNSAQYIWYTNPSNDVYLHISRMMIKLA